VHRRAGLKGLKKRVKIRQCFRDIQVEKGEAAE
jgi:hypothetical protein